MTSNLLGAMVAVACAAGGAAAATNLKPIDPVVLRGAVDALAREMPLPAAMVLLRTPEGDFVHGYGGTVPGGATAPGGGTHFQIASNTKTVTAAVAVLLAHDGKLHLD